jgi:hypothetical protein
MQKGRRSYFWNSLLATCCAELASDPSKQQRLGSYTRLLCEAHESSVFSPGQREEDVRRHSRRRRKAMDQVVQLAEDGSLPVKTALTVGIVLAGDGYEIRKAEH